ncbi:hypothetical protein C8R43DRAFT_1126690 [Mycena crocata]|nr:hypothetical protein C8R43DRAFT_1126690 [Mycena crocata]
MDAPEKPGRVTRSRAAKGKGAVVEPARVSPPKRPRKRNRYLESLDSLPPATEYTYDCFLQAPATDDDKKAVVTNRKTKASPDMQTDIQTPEDKMQLDAPEDKMQLDATAVAEDKMQLDERREEEQEQERVWRIQEQPTDDRPAQLEEHELNPVAPVAAAQADLESVRESSGTSALRAEGLATCLPAEAELHAQYYPVSPAPMAAQQASSAPTWGPSLWPALAFPALFQCPSVLHRESLDQHMGAVVSLNWSVSLDTHAGMIRPVAETTERTPSPSPTRSGNAPSSSPPHRAASSPVRDDEEDEQDHQQDDDEDEHDDEQGQEQEQEVDEQEQHETKIGSEDDYAATREAEDRQLKKARATPSWLPIETTQEEDDEEDNREFEAEVDGQRVVNRKGPPKRKAADSVEDDDGEQGGTSKPSRRLKKVKRNAAAQGGGGGGGGGGGEYKAGPIDKGSVNLLFRWKEELEEKVEELARDIRKPEQAKTGWNMWQAWLYTPKERGGGGQRPDPSLSKKEQAHQDREKLREELPADVRHLATRSDIVFKNLPWLVEWNSKMEAELLADRQSSGAMLRGVAATAKEFTKLCEVAEKELDLHVLGSIISTNGGSCAFGSSKAVKMYKQRHHVEEKKNLTTMEAHIRYGRILCH